MTRRRAAVLAAAAVLVASCAATPPRPELPRTHPASPHADEAPERAPGQTLVMPPQAPAAGGVGERAGKPMRGH